MASALPRIFKELSAQRCTRRSEAHLMTAERQNSKLRLNQRGTATVEYIVISLLVTIGASAAISSLGPYLWGLFNAQATWLALPIH